jgi:hypothetical protein
VVLTHLDLLRSASQNLRVADSDSKRFVVTQSVMVLRIDFLPFFQKAPCSRPLLFELCTGLGSFQKNPFLEVGIVPNRPGE